MNSLRAVGVPGAGRGKLHSSDAIIRRRCGNLLTTRRTIAPASLAGSRLSFGQSFGRCAFDGGTVHAASAGCFLVGSFSTLRGAAYPVERVSGSKLNYKEPAMSVFTQAQCGRFGNRRGLACLITSRLLSAFKRPGLHASSPAQAMP